ncbi:response regulator transcription factor [Aerococcaceae bacterium INB8]|uniref:Response regulator transcription factor n=2 Tax=Ruoffia halotolerans TaxID=2748684 RepID=A0A839A714_9LACT|nr:response regulator transcription factor [Ruoffia halotolerans]
MMKHILVVDDEIAILTLLEYNLKEAGYTVDTANNGESGYKMIKTNEYDFIILDVMLPGMDGMDICRRVRQEDIDTPILMLTAKDDEYDKVIGLELGADDYMTKPFSPREVTARIKAILRRTEAKHMSEKDSEQAHQEAVDAELRELEDNYNDYEEDRYLLQDESDSVIKLGDIKIYADRYEVVVHGDKIEVTPKEFELLVYMAVRKGRILSREQLLNSIWRFDYAGETRIVDVHISHLREKIEKDTKNPEYIKTVRGFGYKFVVPKE